MQGSVLGQIVDVFFSPFNPHSPFQHYESQLAEKSFQINSRLTYFYTTTKHVMSSAMGSYPIPNTEILMY